MMNWCLGKSDSPSAQIMDILFFDIEDIFARVLKGQSQGHNAIFKGLKMTFRTKILKKKYYNTLSASKILQTLF